jgi:hypothetical protein
MRRAVIALAIFLSLLVAGCAGAANTGQAPGAAPTSPPTSETRYETNAIVLQRSSDEPMLCLGAIAESFPPQCGTIPIRNWSWDRVDGEQAAAGSTWGVYHVVGTYDGESFTALEVRAADRTDEAPQDEIEIPCPEPAGGWTASDPSRMSERDLYAAGRLASGEPDSAGWWIKHTQPEPPSADQGGVDTLKDVVMNAAFTGDVERHRRELAAVWGGPLCVVRYDRTESELRRIQSDLTENGRRDFGIQLLFASTDVVHNQVDIGVVVADEGTRDAVDERYGPGTVRLLPALRPLG